MGIMSLLIHVYIHRSQLTKICRLNHQAEVILEYFQKHKDIDAHHYRLYRTI
jgi:hypothetical protein